MPELLLHAENVSKVYTLWHRPSDRLVAPLVRSIAESLRWAPRAQAWANARATRLARPFPALQPIDLKINRGESLGIVGRNGSGKSTLLQILAGTLTPTSGSIHRKGRIAALLELGSGFNFEFTGRENVFLQAAIYGIGAEEMERHFAEVTAFAEIGQFIDQPVKTYSSGMLVRLAFAVQVVLRPELLIVDEALAVGDVFFQAKCAAYFRERLAEGMSLIFVSHDLVSLKALCREAIVLHQGQVHFRGESKAAVGAYHALHAADARASLHGQAKPTQTHTAKRNWKSSDETGDREAEIISCEVVDQTGAARLHYAEGEDIRILLQICAHQDVPVLHAAFQVVDRHNRALYGVSTLHQEIMGQALPPGNAVRLEIMLPGRLGSGEYLIDVAVGWGNRGDGAFTHQCHRVGGIAAISIGRVTPAPRFLGPVDLAARLAWLSE